MKSKTHRHSHPRRPNTTAAHASSSKGWGFRFVVFLTAALVAIMAVRIMRSDSIDPVAYTLPEPHSLTGSLAPNEELKKSVRLAEKQLLGPESLIVHEGNIYTGTVFGRIVKIDKSGALSVFLQQGKGNCTTIMACGRPLGMRLHKSKKFFYVADAYYGLYKVDLKTAKAERIFPVKDEYQVTLFNDVDILPDGNLVVAESSFKWPLHKLVNDALESRGNGRLIHINMKDRSHEVVASDLHFANGVQVDLRDGGKESVLVSETWRNRITRVFIAGPRRGQKEVFADVPGMVDNIRANEAGDGYWVGLASVRSKEFHGMEDVLSSWPKVRMLVHKILPMQTIHHHIRTFYGMAVKLDLQGRIVGSLQDTNGSVIRDVAEVVEHNGFFYFGNYDSTYLARLDKRNLREAL